MYWHYSGLRLIWSSFLLIFGPVNTIGTWGHKSPQMLSILSSSHILSSFPIVAPILDPRWGHRAKWRSCQMRVCWRFPSYIVYVCFLFPWSNGSLSEAAVYAEASVGAFEWMDNVVAPLSVVSGSLLNTSKFWKWISCRKAVAAITVRFSLHDLCRSCASWGVCP